MRIALLGGSFDPIHQAHLELALAAKKHLQADQVQLIPAAQPWQRKALGASAQHRLAMLELALPKNQGLTVNPLEIRRGGPTYTLDTLRELPSGPDYLWILGSDQLSNFCSWKNWQAILEFVQLAVAQRPGSLFTAPADLQQHLDQHQQTILSIPFAPMAISATEIRARIRAGQDVQQWLPEAVLRYIQQHQLYRNTD